MFTTDSVVPARLVIQHSAGILRGLKWASLMLGLGGLLSAGYLLIAQPAGAQVPPAGSSGVPKAPITGNRPQDTATATPTCPPAWGVVSSPNTGAASDYLNGVAAVSANDVWAVGYNYDGEYERALIEHWDGSSWSVVPGPNSPSLYYSFLHAVAAVSSNNVWAVGESGNGMLIEHWNGTSWSIVPSPNPSDSYGYLYSIAAASSNDVWAVGYYYDYINSTNRTLVERWNGSSWSIVTSPNVGSAPNNLSGVAAVSANDVWAVGFYDNASFIRQTLIEHWNGSSWSVVPSPNPSGSTDNYLGGVAAVSANDVWAVGYTNGGLYDTLVEHWNGSTWSILPSPSPGYSNDLYSVAAVAANDVWAVGYYDNISGTVQTLVEHWNGATWSIVTSPNPGTYSNYLHGVAAVSANDVWAVGESGIGTLVEHWNGTSWSIVPSPSPGSGSDYLNGVAAVSANDVWAVGYYYNTGNHQTLIEHWDGSSWSIVPSPNPSTCCNYLYGVAAASANDVWAVGYSSRGTLVEHWNGSSWTIVPSPNPSNSNGYLYGVAVIAANDVWAVGNYYNSSSSANETLVEHWNGSSWNIVTSPNPSTSNVYLQGVAAASTNDVWAVGYYYNIGGGSSQTLIEHWDGSSWSIVPATGPDPYSALSAVAAASTNDVWAVGTSNSRTLAEHWNGSSWSVVPSPGVGSSRELHGLSVVSASDVWAVGHYYDYSSSSEQALVEHWNGTEWSLVPSPSAGTGDSLLHGVTAVSADDVWAVGDYTEGSSPYQTLVERYATGNPCPQPTPTATPTVCAINFTDVQPSDYFYEPVRYLYCHNVISGYSDNTFRPNNLTTRGQFSKIIVLAQGWTIYTPPTPTFRDVSTDQTFYIYIETAYSHGIISGYICDTGPGCLEFRPGNNITRGQLCKIVVLAKNWPIYTPPSPTFQDVPSTDAFYTYIETAYSHGIISGYICGSGCLEFRPGNNATRGQLCKIVYLTVAQP